MTEPSLGQRVLAAADALQALAALQGYDTPETKMYSAWELRQEIEKWLRA